MLRLRTRRLGIAILAMMSLLLSQFVLANYACPGQYGLGTMSQRMAAGMPCDGMDKAQPALCHQVSSPVPPSVETFKLPAPSLPAIVQVIELPLVPETGATLAIPAPDAPEMRPPPEPLFLSTLRLRV
jgi:hypothetical protein